MKNCLGCRYADRHEGLSKDCVYFMPTMTLNTE